MTVAVILVNMFAGRHIDAMRPMLFSILQRLAPELDYHFYDERIEALPDRLEEEVIALSIDTFSARHGYDLAQQYKTEHNTIVLAGVHVTAMPQEASAFADVIITGDAEDTWPQFLEDCRTGRLKQRYDSKGAKPTYVSPVHPSFDKGYLPLGLIQTSRGCRYHCDFCSVKVQYPDGVQRKDLVDVERELQEHPQSLLLFIDDNLYSDQTYFLHLMRLLRKHRKKWAAQVSMDVTARDSLLKLMKRSGCVLLLIGFESLQPDSLTLMNKQANQRRSFHEVVQRVHQAGIALYATFVFGYDTDELSAVSQTVQFANEEGLAVINLNPLLPMPGTPLYERLLKQKRLPLVPWWMDRGYRYGQTAFQTGPFSPKALERTIFEQRLRFYHPRNQWQRFLRNPLYRHPVQAYLFFMLNRVSRAEILRKQSRRLGQ